MIPNHSITFTITIPLSIITSIINEERKVYQRYANVTRLYSKSKWITTCIADRVQDGLFRQGCPALEKKTGL